MRKKSVIKYNSKKTSMYDADLHEADLSCADMYDADLKRSTSDIKEFANWQIMKNYNTYNYASMHYWENVRRCGCAI